MDFLTIAIAALITSGLTLFSGFGLGTLLLPVFAIFFPLEIAVAQTAIVHLANNLFKLVILGRRADLSIVIRFGIPAVMFAFVGAYLLALLSHLEPLYVYTLAGSEHRIMPIALVISVLMVIFAILELLPKTASLSFDKKWLPFGGALSGFFGGLSGHQGALRSAFLIKAGLEKEEFIATGVAIAVLVDFARLTVYGLSFRMSEIPSLPLVLVAIAAAFVGVLIGRSLLKSVTFRTVQITVSIMLFVVAIGLGTGMI